MAHTVLQTEHLDETCRAWLAERCTVIESAPEDPGFDDALARADGLIIRTYTTVDTSLLERSPRLRVVGRAGVGLDSIDVAACRARRIEVVHTPDANTRAVAELVLAVILDDLRPRVALTTAPPLADWKALRAALIGSRQLSDLTVGILGLGRVGRAVAAALAPLAARVLYHDLVDIPAAARAGAEPVSRPALLAAAEILTIHVDARPANRHLVDAPFLDRCRADVLLINTARGFVVDPVALAAFLRWHEDARAVLDVHDPEPFAAEYPLLDLPNARLTPHIGAATETAHRNMSWVVRDVWRVLNGETPEHPAPSA